MNVLMDELPCTVKVAGVEIPIVTDYRTGILFEQALNDPVKLDDEKLYTVLKLYYGDSIFTLLSNMDAVREVLNRIMWFYRCGADETVGTEAEEDEDSPDGGPHFLMNMMPLIFMPHLWRYMESTWQGKDFIGGIFGLCFWDCRRQYSFAGSWRCAGCP